MSKALAIGPRTRDQMRRFGADWKQGEHVVVSGGTGSGKTILTRLIDEERIRRGGFVIVFVCKLTPDDAIKTDYKGFVRWTTFKKNPSPHENRVLLWPETEKCKTVDEMRALQQKVFGEAMDKLAKVGKWTVHVDEGYYFCDPSGLNLGRPLALLHAMGRSSKLTIVTLMQRPSNVPVIIYGSAAHAFVGRTRETMDVKRLSQLSGKESGKELSARIDAQGRHDFLWIPIATDKDPELVNLKQ